MANNSGDFKSGVSTIFNLSWILVGIAVQIVGGILWETGISSDVMKPIAVPIAGGMVTSTIAVMILVPILFAISKNAHSVMERYNRKVSSLPYKLGG